MMWVFTMDGFFAAVWDKNCGRDELMIRAHCREDLVRLSKKLWGYSEEVRILKSPGADYAFRMKIPRQMWSEYVAQCALKVDYANVKGHIVPADEPLRERAYYEVWEALYRWQSELEKNQGK